MDHTIYALTLFGSISTLNIRTTSDVFLFVCESVMKMYSQLRCKYKHECRILGVGGLYSASAQAQLLTGEGLIVLHQLR